MSLVKDRLMTFSDFELKTGIHSSLSIFDWPHETPSSENMASFGFVYQPTRRLRDQVVCQYCGKKDSGWFGVKDLTKHHQLISPKCPRVVFQRLWDGLGQQESSISSLEDVDLSFFKNPFSARCVKFRKKFFNHWKSSKPTASQVINAGFYNIPTTATDDTSVCIYCKVSLEDWEPEDDPLEVHKEMSPDCYFFQYDTKSGLKPSIPEKRKNNLDQPQKIGDDNENNDEQNTSGALIFSKSKNNISSSELPQRPSSSKPKKSKKLLDDSNLLQSSNTDSEKFDSSISPSPANPTATSSQRKLRSADKKLKPSTNTINSKSFGDSQNKSRHIENSGKSKKPLLDDSLSDSLSFINQELRSNKENISFSSVITPTILNNKKKGKKQKQNKILNSLIQESDEEDNVGKINVENNDDEESKKKNNENNPQNRENQGVENDEYENLTTFDASLKKFKTLQKYNSTMNSANNSQHSNGKNMSVVSSLNKPKRTKRKLNKNNKKPVLLFSSDNDGDYDDINLDEFSYSINNSTSKKSKSKIKKTPTKTDISEKIGKENMLEKKNDEVADNKEIIDLYPSDEDKAKTKKKSGNVDSISAINGNDEKQVNNTMNSENDQVHIKEKLSIEAAIDIDGRSRNVEMEIDIPMDADAPIDIDIPMNEEMDIDDPIDAAVHNSFPLIDIPIDDDQKKNLVDKMPDKNDVSNKTAHSISRTMSTPKKTLDIPKGFEEGEDNMVSNVKDRIIASIREDDDDDDEDDDIVSPEKKDPSLYTSSTPLAKLKLIGRESNIGFSRDVINFNDKEEFDQVNELRENSNGIQVQNQVEDREVSNLELQHSYMLNPVDLDDSAFDESISVIEQQGTSPEKPSDGNKVTAEDLNAANNVSKVESDNSILGMANVKIPPLKTSNLLHKTEKEEFGEEENARKEKQWKPLNIEAFTQNYEDLKHANEYLTRLTENTKDVQLSDDVDGYLTNFVAQIPEKETNMTIKEWIEYQSGQCEKLLQMKTDSMIERFEEEGKKAIQVILDL